MGPEDDVPADALDLSGLVCPRVVLRLAEHLRGLRLGSRVTVIATDPLSGIDVPYFLDKRGHRLVSRRRMEGRLVFIVEKGEDGAAA
jgi:tRNA 2-thiouridine synthesizing protein A